MRLLEHVFHLARKAASASGNVIYSQPQGNIRGNDAVLRRVPTDRGIPTGNPSGAGYIAGAPAYLTTEYVFLGTYAAQISGVTNGNQVFAGTYNNGLIPIAGDDKSFNQRGL